MAVKSTTLGSALGLLLLSFGTSTTVNGGDEPVDFGDSGIVVVVEAEGESEGIETSLAFWFPDEFLDFYPGFNWFRGFPGFPGWGDDGNGPDVDPCDVLASQRDLLQQIYDDLLTEFMDGLEGGKLDYKGKDSKYGSSGWTNQAFNLFQDLQDLREQLNAFDEAMDDCGC